MNSNNLNKNMIDGQIKPINGMTQNLISTFNKVDRVSFMPNELKNESYIEKNIIIKDGRVIPNPALIAKIIMHIELEDHENVLLLGSTTGYLAALLSFHAQTVIVVEEDKELLQLSENSIKENNINNVVFFNNEITKGCVNQSPFNVIIIEGGIEEIPNNILDQLEIGGRMLVIISKNDVCTAEIIKKKESNIYFNKLFNCSLPILNGFKLKNTFSF